MVSPIKSVSSKFELTSCQQNALALLKGADNIFLTGVAGSGKSFLLNQFLKEKDWKIYPVVASTGVAAVLVRGVTFHSFFGLGIMEGGLEKTLKRAFKDKRLKKRLTRANAVVIDEISMIPGKALHAAELICQKIRGKPIPWGGLRIIAVGDFGQLPPVNVHDEMKDWAFMSETWRKSGFQVAYLKTVMRSRDEEFLEVLNFIRDGEVNETVTKFLDSRVQDPGPKFSGTILFPHRHSVEEYNLKKLEGLPGKIFSFKTEYSGKERFLDQIKKTAPVPEVLHLKIGALVMIRKNDPNHEFVNGSLGRIKAIDSSGIGVYLSNGNYVAFEKETFSCLNAEGEEVAAAKNFPVNLAWATTIHKSQGMTLDSATMDLSKVFEAGQTYVALSRVKSAKELYLTAWDPKTIRASEEVKAFHRKIFENYNSLQADAAPGSLESEIE